MISTSSHGVVTLQNDEGTLFKVNDHRLKIFLEPKKPHEDLDEVDFLIFTIDLHQCHPLYVSYWINILFGIR